jgi:ferric iron reductase protein FhuF
MTASLEPTNTTHPLNATLEKIQASFTWVKLYTKPEGENWYSYKDIINPEGGVFTMLLEHYQNHTPSLNKRQAVQNLFGSLAWWCASACYAPVLLDERSPTNLEVLYFHLHDEGYIDTMALEFTYFLCLPDDIVATHSRATVVSSREELVKTALQNLQTILRPLIQLAKNHTTIQDKALWLYLADNMASLVLHVKQASKQQARCEVEVETVLEQLPERGGTGVLEVTYGNERDYFTKRSTCCFYYLNPEGKKCATCPKLKAEERLEQLQRYMAERIGNEQTGEVAT